ncbi:MAG TPA: phage major capsid protein, partial [Aestuariivirgaceae bacterium]|nr:phage major capsid protein [Aestuariivirgaceae bacterium]
NRRLDEIEQRMSADVLSEEKVDRINRVLDEHTHRIDDLQLKARRPSLEGFSAESAGRSSEHKRLFDAYVRKGDANGLINLERKALSAGSSPDGGYLVPEETETQIGRLLTEASPIRLIASVRQVSAAIYKKPFAISGAATGWVAETAVRPETAGPTLSELQFPAMEIYAMPAATQTLLDDSVVSIDQWIAEEVQAAFAEQETDAFVNGNGTSKPRGFLDYTKIADGIWSWGNIGYIATGADGGFAETDPSDVLVDLIYALKSGYRQNARWVMNRKTQSEIRKLKDSAGDYLWQPAATASGQATLINFPITEAETMPDIGAGTYPVAFGDFRRGYLIVDRLGIRILRDPFTAKPYVLFYTTKRVGGGVQNFEAIKLLKFAIN